MRKQLPPVEADSTQRRYEGAPLGAPSRRLGRYVLPAGAAASAALLLGGCSGDSGTASVAKTAEPPTVEKLGSAVKCKAEIRKKVEDYRLGDCKAKKTLFTFVTFKDNRAKRGWLDFSKDYGGTYLVGSRWIVVTDKASSLGPIQAQYGGTVERGAGHGGHGRA